MAMKIGGKYRFNDVQARHWDRFAEAVGLSQAQTRKRVARMAERLPSAARCLGAQDPYRDDALVRRIVDLIEQRCALTLGRFNAY
jgi:serine/threonine-protein kinase HipA